MAETDREEVKQALERARRRWERSRPIPLAVVHGGMGALFWYVGVPLWMQFVNALLWAWGEYGSRRMEAERRMEPVEGGTVLEKLRWELTRRERSMEISWPWELAPRAVSLGFLMVVQIVVFRTSWWSLANLAFWLSFFLWLLRKRNLRLLESEFAQLRVWEGELRSEICSKSSSVAS